MKNMKIYSKLMLAFVIVIVLALIMGVVGMLMISMVSNMATELFDEHVIGLEIYATMQADQYRMRIQLNRLAMYAAQSDRRTFDDTEATYSALVASFIDHVATFGKLNLTDAEKNIHAKFEQTIRPNYAAARSVYIETLEQAMGDWNRIEAALARMADAADPLEAWLSELLYEKEQTADNTNVQSDNLAMLSMVAQIVLLIIVMVFSVFIAMFIATGIEKSLKDIISKLSMSTMSISSSAAQLADASESLATGSSRQAAAIEETSATMNETSSMVSQNAENTRVASQLASDAMDEVGEAGKHMGGLMSTMGELKESSDKVSKIVKTIDDIAFQTNLLAINATVEAARAGGDAGRSFAVVAQEVRSLAQRSADSSRETAEIIEKNMALTDTSKVAAERVMTIAQNNAAHTSDLGKLISEINAASEEQASGIKQINIAISQMEKVTQENAAVAEENAAASNSMMDEIRNLEDAVAIAKSLVRDKNSSSSPSSSLGTPRPPSLSPSKAYSNSNTSSVQKPSSSSTAYKSAGSSTAKKTDADKIIPLDEDDDF